MKAKIWTLVFTVILFAAVSGCGKTAAQETEITQQASLEAADKAFCEAGAAQAESFFKTGAASCPVLHSYGPYPSYYLDDGARSWRSGQTRRRKQTARWRFSFKDPTVRSRIRY